MKLKPYYFVRGTWVFPDFYCKGRGKAKNSKRITLRTHRIGK